MVDTQPSSLYVIGNSESEDLFELVRRCKANVLDYDEDLLRLAFNYCVMAHEGRLSISGEKYYIHPLSVAFIIIEEIPLDMDAIAAALLHNVLDESDIYTFEDIKFTFGDNIAIIVDAITRIKLVESQHIGRADQIDNYRKLLLALFKDIRIILVKLADKLDNMRKLDFVSQYTQKQMAQEIMDIYAPFANRFGLTRIKFELEDLAFRYLSPEIYKQIEDTLQSSHYERSLYVEHFKHPIVQKLEQEGLLQQEKVTYRINGRAKNIYSIYNKTLLRQKTVQELYDIFAIRIILTTNNPLFCYYVYGIVGSLYKPIPETFKDYISVPKDNGYKSLHTAVAGPGDKIVEVQIRTEAMHQASEWGVAAHFRYKSSVTNSSVLEDKNIQTWLDDVRNVFEQIGKEDSQKLLSLILSNKLDNKIYVFTPKDEFKEFPRGSTVLDFAFAIHTDLGIRCLGAKINGKFYSVGHILSSGDKVEILVSNNNEAQKEWLDYVVTTRATTSLMSFLEKEDKKIIRIGKKIWEEKNKLNGFKFTQAEAERTFRLYNFDSSNDFYYALGNKQINLDNIYQIMMLELVNNLQRDIIEKEPATNSAEHKHHTNNKVIPMFQVLHNVYEKTFEFAKCCNPLPGDSIYGIEEMHNVVSVHDYKCLRYKKLQNINPTDIIILDWEYFAEQEFLATLKIIAENKADIVNDILRAVCNNDKNQVVKIAFKTSNVITTVLIKFKIKATNFIQDTITAVEELPNVRVVERLQ